MQKETGRASLFKKGMVKNIKDFCAAKKDKNS